MSRSRCSAPAISSPRRWRPSPTCARSRASTADPIAAALDEQPSVLVLADVGPVAGAGARPARALRRGRRRAAALRRVAARGRAVRRPRARDAAARRPHLRRRAVLGQAEGRWRRSTGRAPSSACRTRRDVTVSRQVLAEPDAGLPGPDLGALDDGTPLVTADRRGKGTIVLFHVTGRHDLVEPAAVGPVRRHAAPRRGAQRRGDARRRQTRRRAAHAAAGTEAAALAPTRILDGFGTLGPPPRRRQARAAGLRRRRARCDHPPGFYGPPDALARRQRARPGRSARCRRPVGTSARAAAAAGRRAGRPPGRCCSASRCWASSPMPSRPRCSAAASRACGRFRAGSVARRGAGAGGCGACSPLRRWPGTSGPPAAAPPDRRRGAGQDGISQARHGRGADAPASPMWLTATPPSTRPAARG